MLSMMGAPHPDSLPQRLHGCHFNGIFLFVLMVMCLFNNVCLLQDQYLNHDDSEYMYVISRTSHSQYVKSIHCHYSTSTPYCQLWCCDRIRSHLDTTSVNRHIKVNGVPICMGGFCCDNGAGALCITLHSGTSSQSHSSEVVRAIIQPVPAMTWASALSYEVNKTTGRTPGPVIWPARSNVSKAEYESHFIVEGYHVRTVGNECITNSSEFTDIFQSFNNLYWTGAIVTQWEVKIAASHPWPATELQVTSNSDVFICLNCTLWLDYRVPRMGAILTSDSDIGFSSGWLRYSSQYYIFAPNAYLSVNVIYSTYLSHRTKYTSDRHDLCNMLWGKYKVVYNIYECKYMGDTARSQIYRCCIPQLYYETRHTRIYSFDCITDDYVYVDILQDCRSRNFVALMMTSLEARRAIPQSRPMPDPCSTPIRGRRSRLIRMICMVSRVRRREAILASDGVQASGLVRYRYIGRCGYYTTAFYSIDKVYCESFLLWSRCPCRFHGGDGLVDIYCHAIDRVFISNVKYVQWYLSSAPINSEMNANIPFVTNGTHMCSCFMLRLWSSKMISIPISYYSYIMSIDAIPPRVTCIYMIICTCCESNLIIYMTFIDELRLYSYIFLHTTGRVGRFTVYFDELYIHAVINAYFHTLQLRNLITDEMRVMALMESNMYNNHRPGKRLPRTTHNSPSNAPSAENNDWSHQLDPLEAVHRRAYGNSFSIGFAYMFCICIMNKEHEIYPEQIYDYFSDRKDMIQSMHVKQMTSIRIPVWLVGCGDMLHVNFKHRHPKCKVVIFYFILWPCSRAL